MSNDPNLRGDYEITIWGEYKDNTCSKIFTGRIATFMPNVDFVDASRMINFLKSKMSTIIDGHIQTVKRILIGDGPQQYTLYYMIQDYGIQSKIEFTKIDILKQNVGWIPIDLMLTKNNDLANYTIV